MRHPAPVKTRQMQIIERKTGEPIEVTLYRLYHVEGKALYEVGRALGVSQQCVSKWLHDLAIPVRKRGRQPGTRVSRQKRSRNRATA